MERCTTLTYRGKEILLFDYKGLHGQELLATIQTATQIMLKGEPGELLILADFSDTYLDDRVIGYLTNSESRAASRNARKIAVVGVTGLKKIFFNMYNAVTLTKAKACDSVEAAKEYLMA
jgi:hypothetical protein